MEYTLEEKYNRLLQEDAAQKKKEGPPLVLKVLDLIIQQAVEERATDVHLEPERDGLRIRFRIDGVLHEVLRIPNKTQLNVISSLKIKAKMSVDPVERSIPQSGHLAAEFSGMPVDFRLSSFPTAYGDKVVMRVLDRATGLYPLDQLGFSQNLLPKFKKLLEQPYGAIFVTGPTSSGKTTTLYAVLNTLNTPDRNIITLEDPVEYDMDGMYQGQINPKIGFTFAEGLRAILRQDPNIIFIGEIRDLETAEIAMRSSLVGQLVFSTLHTNDAPGAITRLVDMGVEPFLISSSLLGVLNQRLVRIICQSCRTPEKPPDILLAALSKQVPDMDLEKVTLYKGRGCPVCKNTGYKGRTGVFEMMVMNDELREATLKKVPVRELRQIARKHGMRTLEEVGMEKVVQGITTVEEVLRVT